MPVSCVHRCTLLLLFTFVLCFVSCLLSLFPDNFVHYWFISPTLATCVHVATSIFTDETFISEISRIIPVIKVDYSRFRTAKEMAAAIAQEYSQLSTVRHVSWTNKKVDPQSVVDQKEITSIEESVASISLA